MNHKNFLLITGILFLIFTILHILRLLFGWSVVMGGCAVPMWASWVVLVIAAYLAFTAFKLRKTL